MRLSCLDFLIAYTKLLCLSYYCYSCNTNDEYDFVVEVGEGEEGGHGKTVGLNSHEGGKN